MRGVAVAVTRLRAWRLAASLLVLALALSGGGPALARDAAPQSAHKLTRGAGGVLPSSGTVSVREARALLANPPAGLIILDVRTPQEFREGHLPGARNLDFFGGGFEMQAEALPKDAPLLLYCRSGRRSAAAAEALTASGRGPVLDLREGVAGWKKAGLPLEK